MATGRRLILDVSSVARWAGPPGGIVRVEQQLQAIARTTRPDIITAVFDPDLGGYRTIRDEWKERLLGESAALVLSDGPALARRGWRRLVPRRGDVMFALERVRLTTARPALARAIDRLQRAAAGAVRHSIQMFAPGGDRFAYVPAAVALGGEVGLGPGDTVLTVGYDWIRKSPASIAALKTRTGARYVVTCYDMIPVLHPEFYEPAEVAGFESYWRDVLPLADAVIAISARTRADLTAWAHHTGVHVPRLVVVPLASSIGAPGAAMDERLPAGLTAGRYVLMVGTIEPRKGHRLMLDVWRALMADGVPQRLGFVLVLVGRRGWKTEALLAEIAAAGGPYLRHIDDAWDGCLERLYHDAAFCVMPSLTEGFGLPIVEAFSHGKAVLASNGGALPEVVGDLSPCLDPEDRPLWQREIRRWMEQPEARRPYEAQIARTFRRPTWSAVADACWNAALSAGGAG